MRLLTFLFISFKFWFKEPGRKIYCERSHRWNYQHFRCSCGKSRSNTWGSCNVCAKFMLFTRFSNAFDRFGRWPHETLRCVSFSLELVVYTFFLWKTNLYTWFHFSFGFKVLIQTLRPHYRVMHHGFLVLHSQKMESTSHHRPVIKRLKSGMLPNENVCTHLTIMPIKYGVLNTVPIATKSFPYLKIEVSICTIVPLISLKQRIYNIFNKNQIIFIFVRVYYKINVIRSKWLFSFIEIISFL